MLLTVTVSERKKETEQMIQFNGVEFLKPFVLMVVETNNSPKRRVSQPISFPKKKIETNFVQNNIKKILLDSIFKLAFFCILFVQN